MKLKELLKTIGDATKGNFFLVAPDNLGLEPFLARALRATTAPEDQHTYDATHLTKEKARQVEAEARRGPRGGSARSHFYLYRLQALPTDSVGVLLKAVEEARFARFTFQAQTTPRKLRTLMSRSMVHHLPFMSRTMVLGNLSALNLDAKQAEELSLWDGTLGGTQRILAIRDAYTALRRELKAKSGMVLMADENLESGAFDAAVTTNLETAARRFLENGKTKARQKLAIHYHLTRR
jgi:hypothetical protein